MIILKNPGKLKITNLQRRSGELSSKMSQFTILTDAKATFVCQARSVVVRQVR